MTIKDTLHELNVSLERLVKGRLWVKILISLVAGVLFGLLLGPTAGLVPSKTANIIVNWLAVPGHLFLSLIQLVIIPLVFASVVLGIVSSENLSRLKSLGIRIGAYYIVTTLVAVGLGFVVAYIIKPGQFIDPQILAKTLANSGGSTASAPKMHSVTEVLTGLIPNNPFNALVSGEMLQVVLLAIFIGIALMSLDKSDAKPMTDLLNSFQKISMTIIGWAMHLAPIAVFSLTARLLAQVGLNALYGLGVYVLTVILGLSLVMVFYLFIVRFFGGIGPLDFLRRVRDVQLLAFSTSSSASVMPLTISTAEKNLNIRPSIAKFVIPLGTTVNMDGTALYQGIATIFLSQVFGVDLSFGQLALVVMTATMSSIGAPGAPGVGMAVLSVILGNVGIPPSGIMLIIGVDRILDMCRTVINVTGDLTASVVMNRWSLLPENETFETQTKTG